MSVPGLEETEMKAGCVGGVQLRVGQEQSRGVGAAGPGPPNQRQRGVSHQGPPTGGASGQLQSPSTSLASTLQARLQPFIFLPIGAALPHHTGRPDAGPWGQGLEAPHAPHRRKTALRASLQGSAC